MHWSTIWNNNYTLAVFTAICGFIFAVAMQRIQDRRAPRKAISWDATIDRKQRVDKDDEDRIGISYNGVPVKDLVQVRIQVENTGNTLVRNEYVRFRMPKTAKILEVTTDPAPEPELGVAEDKDPALSPRERRYKIGHLEAGQSVGFHIATDGGDWLTWKDIHPHNEEGGVLFQRRDIARAKEDAEEVQPFIRNLAAFLLLAMLTFVTPAPGSFAFALLALLPCFNIMNGAPRILRVLQRLLSPNDSPRAIYVSDSQGIQIGEENVQSNTYS
jgi:hypothetical protein